MPVDPQAFDPQTVVLLLVAIGFALVNGANDGATLVAAGLKVPALPPLAAIGLLAAVLAAGPLVFGTRVATTLAGRLVSFEAEQGLIAGSTGLLVAVVTAVAVVVVLARRGLPTSLTLALVGGITGAGLGGGLPVSWSTFALVAFAGLLAPLLGTAGGFVLSHLSKLVPVKDVTARTKRLHVAAFTLQCLAYAANDGQKILAVTAIALGAAGADTVVRGQVALAGPVLVAIAVVFSVGLIVGLRRVAETLGTGLMRARPSDAVAAEFSSATVVLGTAAFGAPVSMTQSVAGALVGSGMSVSYQRVRWRAVGRLGLAWVITLPISTVLAAVLARGGGWVF